MHPTEHMHELLAALELALLESGRWSEKRPDDTALASTEPFCVDTLHFHEWLQWVYIPKMRAFIAAHAALPERSGLLPMAEEAWKSDAHNSGGLLLVMRALDALVNGDADYAQHLALVEQRYRRH